MNCPVQWVSTGTTGVMRDGSNVVEVCTVYERLYLARSSSSYAWIKPWGFEKSSEYRREKFVVVISISLDQVSPDPGVRRKSTFLYSFQYGSGKRIELFMYEFSLSNVSVTVAFLLQNVRSVNSEGTD